MNKEQIRSKMAEAYDKMKAAEGEAFDGAKKEFDALRAALERAEALEAAEKAFVASQPPMERKAADGEADGVKALADAARKGFSVASDPKAGYTVPSDVETKINKLREAKESLRSLVRSETVSAPTGSRVYQKRGAGAGFASVAEGGMIPPTDEPEFVQLDYKVEKLAGYMYSTDELLEDSDANIAGVITEWFAENMRVSENKMVLAGLNIPYTRDANKKAAAAVSSLDDLKKIVNVKLGQAFAPTSVIVTNDDGLQWLDTLKDNEGHSLLKSVENDPLKQYVAIGFRNVPLKVVPNSDLPTSEADGVPMYVGDLKEAVTLFQKKGLSIMGSNTASIGEGEGAINAFGQDLTIWRGIVRMDVELIDEESYVKAFYKAANAG